MTSSKEEVIPVTGIPVVAAFRWSVGELMDRFIRELGNKKILGAKCSKCNYTYVPPRIRCGKCSTKMDEKNLTELSSKGVLVGYTTAYVELDGNGNFRELEKPKAIGAIKLDGAGSTIYMPLVDLDPEKLKVGMKVEVVWREETKGEIADIKGFKPAK
ncbi:MAG: Zn-ribbon domain-containing OB-fold protein [Candidatus Jordarchaeum sp.]|uniref:Zn-ribbon domain-containing OB-fold protein n=1 Tax=Candidatus Jordarchaeum sp. TaxID=2823881 RepID=UPI004048F559